MNSKQYFRNRKRKSPKTFAKIEKRWDIKLIPDVMAFVSSILDNVNPKLSKKMRKDDWVIKGPEIEEKTWKLLSKLRAITLREKRHDK